VRLAYGDRLVVRIIKTGDVGNVYAFAIRRGGFAPKVSCLAPGSTKPERC